MADPVFNYVAINPFGLAAVDNYADPVFVDIDNDGDSDAFVGNSDGNTLFFKNTGTASNPVFAAAITNPFGLTDAGDASSPDFVDIDGDGDLDAFVGEINGNTLFFRNTGAPGSPSFAATVTNPFGLNDVGGFANPTFADIDGDGDLDAFVGDDSGSTNFFKNTGSATNPIFAAPADSPFGLFRVGGYGVSPSFVDIDNDGDLDAFLGWGGDFNSPEGAFFLRNVGTVDNPVFYSDSQNPFGLSNVGQYGNNPAFVDIDDDNDLDVFIGNSAGDSVFFQNKGAGSSPYYSFSGIDLNDANANPDPHFVDIDNDGDLDAFVGNDAGNTLFFRNTGTASNPIFAAAITNPFGLRDVGATSNPELVDIDNDGDLDAFIGNGIGNTLFFRNTGTVANPAFAAPQTNPFGLGDIGTNARPTFVDIDADNDLDIFVNDAFFKNIGTAGNPSFAAAVNDPFGLIGSSGNDFDFIDVDKDGDLDAFAYTQFFRNTGSATNPAFSDGGEGLFGLPQSVFRSHIEAFTFVDIDGDGDLDAYVTGSYSYSNEYPFAGFQINNNAPNVTNLTAPEVYTKGTPLDLKNIVISDPDSADVTATLTLSNSAAGRLSTATAGAVTSTYNVSTGKWTASGALADVNTLLAGVVFTPAKNFTNAFTINASISDGVAEPLLGSKSFAVSGSAGVVRASTPGNDILTGTASSSDTVTYASATGPVTVSLNITTQQNTVNAGLDTITKIENLIGSSFADNLTGNSANNILEGKGGNDKLAGWSGADTMIGGPGNDTYFVENAGDIVTENPSQGIDTVSSRLTYTLSANVENLTLTGTSAINGTGNGQANTMIGNSAANQLNGGAGNDVLNGAGGKDILDGGTGTNTSTGGPGQDIFRFSTTSHTDTITDYNVASDTIQLDNAVFTALTATGTLAAGQFRVGTKALDANDFIIYNSATGTLLYDANGSGAGAAVQIATIGSGLAMTHAEIAVI
jgi:Ca2+-binding RTX toxin-like protein